MTNKTNNQPFEIKNKQTIDNYNGKTVESYVSGGHLKLHDKK